MMPNIKRYIFVLAVACISLGACNSKHDKSSHIENQDTLVESFDAFFAKFNSDSAFQRSRVAFPLRATSIEDDDTKTIKFISKEKWQYANFPTIKNIIIKKTAVTNKSVTVDFSIQDTGVQVQYYFVSKMGKWWLTSTEDQSD